jgi:hypothetical protein
MVAWYWLVVAFVGGLVFATITWNAVEWDNAVGAVLAGIAIPFVWVAMFPISFFRSYFKPISPERWAKYLKIWNDDDKYWKVGKNTYLWHDPNAKKLFNKFFLIRVKRT